MRFLGWALMVLLMLEVLSVVLMADWLGGGVVLLLMLASFIIGLMMMRNIGFAAVMLAGASVRQGQGVSLYQLLWPIRFVVAALLLMSPGFISDLLAVVLMLPFKGGALRQPHFGSARQKTSDRQDDVIEGEYTVSDHEPKTGQHSVLPPNKY